MASPLSHVAQLQYEIEGALARKFSGALSPRLKAETVRQPIGVAAVDVLLTGGIPVGGMSELVGTESSGRTTVVMSLLAKVTGEDTATAWIDASDSFDPLSAAQCGVDLRRLLWVRCADAPAPVVAIGSEESVVSEDSRTAAHQQVPRGSGSPHPRSEAHGMPDAVAALLQSQPRSAAIHDRRARRNIGTPGAPNRSVTHFPSASPYREEQIPTDRTPARRSVAETKAREAIASKAKEEKAPSTDKPVRPYCLPVPVADHALHRTRANSWHAIDRALRSADLLLQAGGFSVIVLDMGSIPAEMALRIPLSTWFRFRAACERTRTTMVLMTQHACTKSSADLLVRMTAGQMKVDREVMTGIRFVAEVERERSRTPQASKVVSIRKSPQSDRDGIWQGHAAWSVGL